MKNEVAAGRIESAYEQPRATAAHQAAPKSESCKPGQSLGTSETLMEVENEKIVDEPVAPGASVGAAIGESTGRPNCYLMTVTGERENVMDSNILILGRLIRDADGCTHKPGEVLKPIREIDQLGRKMMLVEYPSHQRGYVFPEDVERRVAS